MFHSAKFYFKKPRLPVPENKGNVFMVAFAFYPDADRILFVFNNTYSVIKVVFLYQKLFFRNNC